MVGRLAGAKKGMKHEPTHPAPQPRPIRDSRFTIHDSGKRSVPAAGPAGRRGRAPKLGRIGRHGARGGPGYSPHPLTPSPAGTGEGEISGVSALANNRQPTAAPTACSTAKPGPEGGRSYSGGQGGHDVSRGAALEPGEARGERHEA